MDLTDYPVDFRADQPARSSRLWAVLTIFLIKFLALIPHFFLLVFLGIAQWVVALVAQIVVAVRGEYPPGMFRFVVGVQRWGTRVAAFALSLTDRYPPFSLEPDPDYPVDLTVERPAQSNRLYALFSVIVQVLVIAGGIALAVVLVENGVTANVPDSDWQSWWQGWGNGLFLRQLAALPHYIILFFLSIAVFLVWFVVQWVILFAATYPKGMYDFSVGVVRWQLRVQVYALGLSDRYPPFGFDPSIGAAPVGPAAVPTGATAPAGPYPQAGPAATATPSSAPASSAAWTDQAGPASAPSGSGAPADQVGQAAATAPPTAPTAPQAPAVAPAQWYPDPSGRHQYRYWDGRVWTTKVADNGVESSDSL
jgi:hypothetical protein